MITSLLLCASEAINTPVETEVRDQLSRHGGKWELKVSSKYHVDGDPLRWSEIWYNSRPVWSGYDHDDTWWGCRDIGFLHHPDGTAYVVSIWHSAMGHFKETRVFSIDRGKVRQIWYGELENGGPVFRDLDGDGEVEWVWDSRDWYTDYGKTPRWLFAYKPGRDGVLRQWQQIPNRNEVWLPMLLGEDYDGEPFGFRKM